jgi:hypothetical protein
MLSLRTIVFIAQQLNKLKGCGKHLLLVVRQKKVTVCSTTFLGAVKGGEVTKNLLFTTEDCLQTPPCKNGGVFVF